MLGGFMSRITLKGEAWLMKAQALYDLKIARKELEKQEANLSREIQKMTEGKSFQYKGMMSFFEERKGSVNYAAIPELIGVDVDVYRKPPIIVFKLVKV
jgi:predicted nuclease of restriction endonuclease-like RecB superfamily